MLAWDVLKLVKLSKDFEVFQVPLSEIRELKETYWFGLGAPPISEEIAQYAKQIYESDLSYTIMLFPEGKVMVCNTNFSIRCCIKILNLIW